MRRTPPKERIDKPALKERTDGELLSLFVAAHDEAAFAALVQRYERMVLGVCWQVLHHRHDAEGASQNTFLVLVRKASSILREGEKIGGWLHGAAYREALNFRKRRRRRQAHERPCGYCQLAQLAQFADQVVFRES